MRPGDLINVWWNARQPSFPGCLGVLLRKLQYDTDEDLKLKQLGRRPRVVDSVCK